MKENGDRLLRAVRRGVGLAVCAVLVWMAAVTADPAAVESALGGGEERAAVALLAGQTRVPPAEGQEGALELLLRHVPLLARGRGLILPGEANGEVPQTGQSIEEHDDDTDQPQLQPPVGEDGVVELTAQGKEGSQYLSRDGLYLYNRSKLELTPAVLDEGKVDFTLGEGPQILIYHTHGSEAYTQSDGQTYTQSDPYRTTDCTRNVVRVGEEMARIFRSYGFQVIHDTELYDYPAYSGAYERSGAAVRRWLEEYPTIRLTLDVHRDALVGSDGAVYKLISQENGRRAAQVMLVVGTGHEGWRDNLALGVRVQRELLADYVTLARPVVLRSGKYNQDCLPGSLLVEVGGHGNTLTEALDGARLFAVSAAQVFSGL